jgi:hypothetical protein
MRRILLAAFLVAPVLAGCGDDAPSDDAGKSGRPVTPAELEEALRRSGTAHADAQRAAEAAAARVRESMGGGDLEEMGRKASALGARPLTSADVETYIALVPKVRGKQGKPQEMSAVLGEHGLSTPEWLVLSGRMTAVLWAVKLPKDKVDATIAADVETVRPYADRIEAARKAR